MRRGILIELQQRVVHNHIDILAITETWLDKRKPNSALHLDGFLPPFRHDRSSGPFGGVAVYVSENLGTTRLQDLEFIGVESVWLSVTIKDNTKPLVIGTYYRPPGQNAADRDDFLTTLSTSIDLAIRRCPLSLILTGDFNDRFASGIPIMNRVSLASGCTILFFQTT
jgi:exonuclease III